MDNHVIIIAEAGVNHNGSLELAKKLVEEAAKAKVDYIKFQTFKSECGVTKKAEQAEYQKNNLGNNDSQLEMIKKLELPYEAFEEIIDYCNQLGVKFFSTTTDKPSLDFLHSQKPVGMSDLQMVCDAVKVLLDNGLDKKNLVLLHCNTEYPTPYEDVNLRAMQTLAKEFDVPVGYSDHTLGIEVPIAAVAMGASVIEKHFTLDRNMEGPDHKASLEPNELCEMVRTIRNVEKALGDGVKRITESERRNLIIARKSIVAAKSIKKGEMLTEDNITVKRPGSGITPMRWNEVLGTKAIRDFEEDDLIEI